MKLKFRVWNGEEMISPDYIDRNGVAHWEENSIPEKSDKVMLFTGRYDINNKPIYQGDCLEPGEYLDHDEIIVEWDDRIAGFKINGYWIDDESKDQHCEENVLLFDGDELEVIGHVFKKNKDQPL